MSLASEPPSKDAFALNILRDTTMGRYLFEKEYAFIQEQLQTVPREMTSPILEVACGSGHIAMPLHRAGYDIIGMDLDPEALTVFRQDTQAIPLFRGNAEHLPFPDKSVGVIIAIQCFEYFQCSVFLKECSRILKDGGLLIFDAINRNSYKWIMKNMYGRYLDLPSANMSCRAILDVGQENNFEVQKVIGYNWMPFKRESNTRLVHPVATVERTLRLKNYYLISPKFLASLRKKA